MGSQTGGRCCDSVRLSQRLSERHMIQACSHSREEKPADSNTNLLSAPHIWWWAAELRAPTSFGSFTWLMMLFKPDGRRPTAGKQVRLQWLPHVILLRYSPSQEEEMFHFVQHLLCCWSASSFCCFCPIYRGTTQRKPNISIKKAAGEKHRTKASRCVRVSCSRLL